MAAGLLELAGVVEEVQSVVVVVMKKFVLVPELAVVEVECSELVDAAEGLESVEAVYLVFDSSLVVLDQYTPIFVAGTLDADLTDVEWEFVAEFAELEVV